MKPPQTTPKRSAIVKKSINRATVIKQGRLASWTQGEVKKFLAEIGLGKELEEGEASSSLEYGMIITKIKEINSELARANKALRNKEITHEQRLDLMEAKCRLLEIHNETSDRLRDLNSKQASSRGHAGIPPHAFGPREPVGPFQGVQINIDKNANERDINEKKADEKPIDIPKD